MEGGDGWTAVASDKATKPQLYNKVDAVWPPSSSARNRVFNLMAKILLTANSGVSVCDLSGALAKHPGWRTEWPREHGEQQELPRLVELLPSDPRFVLERPAGAQHPIVHLKWKLLNK